MIKIGDISLGDFPLLLAPMEDVSDPPFRALCKENGADVVYTEFISCEGLIRDAAKSIQKLGVFIEVFGEESSGVSKSYWDAGVIYYLTDKLQADLSFSRGINNNSNYINFGLSLNI